MLQLDAMLTQSLSFHKTQYLLPPDVQVALYYQNVVMLALWLSKRYDAGASYVQAKYLGDSQTYTTYQAKWKKVCICVQAKHYKHY